jgi:hypothetical protein
MRPSSTRSRYITSHSAESKSVVERPPRSGAAAEPPSITSFLTLLDLLHGASTLLDCFQRDLRDGAARDRDYRVGEPTTRDSRSP